MERFDTDSYKTIPETSEKISAFEVFLEMTEGSYVVAKKFERLMKGFSAKLTFYKGKSENDTKGTSGLFLRHKLTVAVDPRVIPLGTILEIMADNGEKIIAVAADVCARAKSEKGKIIDIFFGKHEKIPREGIWRASSIKPIGYLNKEKMDELKQNPEFLKEILGEYES